MTKPARIAVFLGSKGFGLKLLECLHQSSAGLSWNILHPDDEYDSRSVIKEFQHYSQINNLTFSKLDSKEQLKQHFSYILPDVIFVCGYYHLIPVSTLNSVPFGVWGIHHSLLPKYRGGAPLVWQIINGEKEAGSTLFKFSNGMDDGDILCQVSTPVSSHDHIRNVMERLETLWQEQIAEQWLNILNRRIKLKAQNESEASYCAQRSPEDGVIDWHDSAKKIDRFIRAQSSPYPGAKINFKGQYYSITEHEIFGNPVYGQAGQILMRDKEKIVVCCAEDTALSIYKLLHNDHEKQASEIITSIKKKLNNF